MIMISIDICRYAYVYTSMPIYRYAIIKSLIRIQNVSGVQGVAYQKNMLTSYQSYHSYHSYHSNPSYYVLSFQNKIK